MEWWSRDIVEEIRNARQRDSSEGSDLKRICVKSNCQRKGSKLLNGG